MPSRLYGLYKRVVFSLVFQRFMTVIVGPSNGQNKENRRDKENCQAGKHLFLLKSSAGNSVCLNEQVFLDFYFLVYATKLVQIGVPVYEQPSVTEQLVEQNLPVCGVVAVTKEILSKNLACPSFTRASITYQG